MANLCLIIEKIIVRSSLAIVERAEATEGDRWMARLFDPVLFDNNFFFSKAGCCVFRLPQVLPISTNCKRKTWSLRPLESYTSTL